MRKMTRGSAGYVQMDNTNLRRLRDELRKHAKRRAHVGIFNDKNAREDDKGNADIGITHEFGSVTRHIPERSFIRMPLLSRLPKAVQDVGSVEWQKLIFRKGLVAGLKNLAALGLHVINDAFETGGFGQWPALSEITIRRKLAKTPGGKGPVAILIDTAQLRQSINTRIV